MSENASVQTQTFVYINGTSSTWTRDGGCNGRYFKDGVEISGVGENDGWGQYFRDYQRHIHKWEPLPNSQQMQHVMHAWDPPRRNDV